MAHNDHQDFFKSALLLILLALLLGRYLAAVDEVLTPLFLTLAIAVVAFTMRVRWARGVALFVVAVAVVWFLSRIWDILFPFVAAFFIAYVVSPVVGALEKRRVSRTWASLALIVVSLAFIAGALFLVVPPIVYQLTDLVAALGTVPRQIENVLGKINAWLATLEEYELSPYARAALEGLIPRAQELTAGLFERFLRVVTSISALATHLVNIIITPIVTFYLLRDMPKIKRWVRDRVPRRYLADADDIYRDVDRVLAGFVRGQFIVSSLEAAFIAAGLTFIGVDFAILLGIFAGFANMVPYVGTYVGALPALVVALLSPTPFPQFWFVLALFAGVNILDGYVLAPRVVGRRVGLHPVVAMVAMLAGAKFFGVVGFLVAVPVTGILRVLALRVERRYFASAVFSQPTAPDNEDG